MEKKIILLSLLLGNIVCMGAFSQAQNTENIGIEEVIFATEIPTQQYTLNSNNIGSILVDMHLIIAQKQEYQLDYQGEILETIKNLEILTRQDIIETLYGAEDKQAALSQYLSECQKQLQKGDAIIVYIKQDMNIIKNNMEACANQKAIYDKQYFDAIATYDQKTMESALTESIRQEKCAIENRIQYNAKAEISKKLVFYLGMLQNKYDMLFEKQDIVAKEFDIFKNKLLPDLNEIDKTLQQYDF